MTRRALGLLLVLTGAPAVAQQQTTFRYRPTAGTTLITLTEVRTVTTVFGLPAVPDGSAYETERRISTTQRVERAPPGSVTVEVTIDSVRARRRALPDGTWTDVTSIETVDAPARATLDERFRVVGLTSSGAGDGRVLRMLGASFVGLGFGFPAGPVTVGETFLTDGTVQVDVRLPPDAGLPLAETVLGELALTLDSVVTTASDELAYFRFRGSLLSGGGGGEDQPADPEVTFTGGFAGRLIWSSGWNGFVSGAARLQIQGQIRSEPAPGAAAEWDVTITHRVRP